MFTPSKELFINKHNRFILRVILLILLMISGVFTYLIYKSAEKLDLFQEKVAYYYQVENKNQELADSVSEEEIDQKLNELSPYLFKDWIAAAEWLEELRENHTPKSISFSYNILGLDYPIENDSNIAILPIEIEFKADSSTSTTVVTQFIENISLKLEPQTVLEDVQVTGNGKGVEKGTLKIRGWILQ